MIGNVHGKLGMSGGSSPEGGDMGGGSGRRMTAPEPGKQRTYDENTKGDDAAIVVEDDVDGVKITKESGRAPEKEVSVLTQEEIIEKYSQLDENIGDKITHFDEKLEVLRFSMDDNGVAGKNEYDSLREDIKLELDVVEELLEANLTNENRDEMISRLLEIKESLKSYNVEVAKSLLPDDLLEASSIDSVVEALANLKLEDFENREEFIDNLRQLLLANSEDISSLEGDDSELSKIKKIAEGFKKHGCLAGMALNVFFDKEMGDLGAFISFILNPTGSSSGGYEYRYAGENGGEIIPYYLFKEKFRNHSLVGRSMSEFSKNHAEELGLSAWDSNNKPDLNHISESSDIVKTHEMMSSFYSTALSGENTNSERNWEVFEKGFATAMFGGKEVSMDEESIEFLKEKLKNDAEELKKFWKMDKEETTQVEEVAPEVVDVSNQPEEAPPES